MTDAPNRTSEIAAYMSAVERHLGDLPEAIRLDLMSELDLHLAEVAADLGPGMTLRDQLGSPESYARELRETAEVQKESLENRLRRGLAAAAAPLAARARTVADRFAASTGHADAGELAARLRPGWWVLRGALVAMLFVYWLASAQFGVTGYSFFYSIPGLIFGVAILLVCIWASLRFGAKSADWGQRRRRWAAAASLVIVALAGYQFSWIITGAIPATYVETEYVGNNPYDYVTDVHVYDENGQRLTGIYLFDQNGEPLWIGDPYACETQVDPFAQETDENGQAVEESFDESVDTSNLGYRYPLCDTGEEQSAAPDADATPSEEPTGADATPSGEPTETAPPTDDASTSSEEPTESASPTGDAPTTK
jgi:hypothetical protein